MTLLASLSLLQTAQASINYATVFVYHRFGDQRYPTTSVSLKDFRKELKYLKEKGYKVIKLSTLYRIISSGEKIPPKTVVITIDDGYRTTYRAFKILKEFNFPFTVFLYMEAVGRYPDFLTIEQIREMEKSGLAEFENHLYSHPSLAKLRAKLTKEEYLKVLRREAELSEKRFKKIFGRKPEFLAFPYGEYDKISVKFFKERGYKLLLTQDRGSYDGKRVLVPRFAVVGSQSGFKRFVRELRIEPLPVKEHRPEIGLTCENPVEVAFRLKDPQNYKNCWIYLSKKGWVKGVSEGEWVRSPRKLWAERLRSRAGIRCTDRETGRKAEFFFLFIEGNLKGAKAPEVVKRGFHQ